MWGAVLSWDRTGVGVGEWGGVGGMPGFPILAAGRGRVGAIIARQGPQGDGFLWPIGFPCRQGSRAGSFATAATVGLMGSGVVGPEEVGTVEVSNRLGLAGGRPPGCIGGC